MTWTWNGDRQRAWMRVLKEEAGGFLELIIFVSGERGGLQAVGDFGDREGDLAVWSRGSGLHGCIYDANNKYDQANKTIGYIKT